MDIHSRFYVVVAQHDHAALKPPRRCAPGEFLPWVESLLRAGHAVQVVYEACGFGFGLYRQLVAAGAQCHVIAPRKLDEERKGVKTDALDAATLRQRLSRYLEGNTLAVIRVPSEEEERARQWGPPARTTPAPPQTARSPGAVACSSVTGRRPRPTCSPVLQPPLFPSASSVESADL